MGLGAEGQARTRAGSRLPHRAECGSPCPPWGRACCYCGAGGQRSALEPLLAPCPPCGPASPFLAEPNAHEARLVGAIRLHGASPPSGPSARAPPRDGSREGSGPVAAPARGGAGSRSAGHRLQPLRVPRQLLPARGPRPPSLWAARCEGPRTGTARNPRSAQHRRRRHCRRGRQPARTLELPPAAAAAAAAARPSPRPRPPPARPAAARAATGRAELGGGPPGLGRRRRLAGLAARERGLARPGAGGGPGGPEAAAAAAGRLRGGGPAGCGARLGAAGWRWRGSRRPQ